MWLRRLFIILAPIALYFIILSAFRLIDSIFRTEDIFSYITKGFILGVGISILLTISGIKCHTNGLVHWLFIPCILLFILLGIQYLVSINIITNNFFRLLLPNWQAVLVASGLLGYCVGVIGIYLGYL